MENRSQSRYLEGVVTLVFYGCMAVGLGAWLAAVVIWAGWIPAFLQRHGRQPAFFLLPTAAVVDYKNALSVARRQNRIPWFLLWFRRLILAATGCLLAALWAALLRILSENGGWGHA